MIVLSGGQPCEWVASSLVLFFPEQQVFEQQLVHAVDEIRSNPTGEVQS